jgi:arsenite/tail-anchored protein-transporting ATPase
MDPLALLTAARLMVVAGKGGVGKTTVSAVVARAAADAGLRVLAVELESKPALASLLHDDERLETITLTPTDALTHYLDTHGLARVSRRLVNSGVVDVVSNASPGLDDLLVLAQLKSLTRDRTDVDVIVVDGPAAGHAVTFLLSPAGLADAVTSGPVATQAREVLEMLHDPMRCQVIMVTTPDTTPISELIETAFELEDRVGVQLGPVVVNGVDTFGPLPGVTATAQRIDPDPDRQAVIDAANARTARQNRQRSALERLATQLPLPLLQLPWVPTAGISAEHLAHLVEHLTPLRSAP